MSFKFLALYLSTSLITFSLFGFISIPKANAASINSLIIDVAPENPSPYEDTTITLSSYVNNLDSVLITWSLNGKKVSSGIGKKTFTTKAGALGSTSTVVVNVSLPEGSLEKKIIIKPNVMVLLFQANDSYVPPFYRGKALPAPDSDIKVVAMPEVSNPKNMTFAWQKDYTNNPDGSGYGKNFFIYTNDYLESGNIVSVTASTIDQQNSFQASINIPNTNPKLVFYKNDPKMGTMYQFALPDPHTITEPEIVEAVPYFIAPKQLDHPRLIWNWFINDNAVPVPMWSKNLMPLKVVNGTHGVSTLKLQIDNKDRIFQTVDKEITIKF
jgi:hypothetical protein